MSAVDDYRKRPAPDTPLDGAISMQYADAAIAELEAENKKYQPWKASYFDMRDQRDRAEAELAAQKRERDEWMTRAEQAEADLADCAKTRGELKDALDAAEAEVARLNLICDRLAAAGHRGDE